jgi:hypothetical protein
MLPKGWAAKAQKALDSVRKATTPKDRADALTAAAPVWHAAKRALASLSLDKCWYCQTAQIRSDDNVDHYRPKGRVAESPTHEGYWWLAFDIINFRYSCTLCNSHRKDVDAGTTGGKQDHFPLFDESKRAGTEGISHAAERPLLLDPTVLTDPILLWFEPDGRVVEAQDKAVAPDLHRRAEVSIELYHLNHTRLKTARRDLCQEIADLIDEGDQHYLDHLALVEAGRRGFASVIKRLRKKLDRKSDHTATAMAMILANRDAKHSWLDVVLSTL